MPIFKSTKDIFGYEGSDEIFDPNWMDSNTLVLPPISYWDYKRDLTIEDVDIWEQISYQGGGMGLYAAWSPYAEFYMITHHLFKYIPNSVETFYGKGAGIKAYKRAKEIGMNLPEPKTIWVEPEDMWLYE